MSVQNLSTSPLKSQITKYEHFIDVVLRGDLQRVSNQYEQICERIVEYINIKSSINAMKEDTSRPFKAMSDIGSNCYVKCVIPKADKIIIHIGLDCFLELNLNEALDFIEKRIALYNETIERLVSNSSKIKAHIKLTLNLIDQLKNNHSN